MDTVQSLLFSTKKTIQDWGLWVKGCLGLELQHMQQEQIVDIRSEIS
jgi:hypothetical protein